jgi:hypothetical protein
MTIKAHVDFLDGEICQREVELKVLFHKLGEVRSELCHWPVDRIIEIFDAFAHTLRDRQSKIHRLYPGSGIPFIANWCRRRNLESLLDDSFGNRYFLDRFIESRARPDRAFRAFPRGTVVHWMAGNVPTLGFLSLVQGMLTKNANVIKLASDSDMLLSALLEGISGVNRGQRKSGQELVQSVAVLRYEHDRRDVGEFVSGNADARVMWGGDESVWAIRRLPSRPDVNDVVFPKRTSLLLVGATALQTVDIEVLARRVALDVSIFEQKACASPHTLFLETEDDDRLVAFAESLKKALQSTLRALPKAVPSQKEVSALLNLRAQYDMFHRCWYSEGTEFTILSDDLFQLGPPVGNRTLYLRKIANLEQVAKLITEKVQSVGIAADPEQFETLTLLFGQRGVQRFAQIGTMTHFESPWNGYFLPSHLVRWSSRPRHRGSSL